MKVGECYSPTPAQLNPAPDLVSLGGYAARYSEGGNVFICTGATMFGDQSNR